MKGVFDGETVEVDWNRPGVVIDISRIRASDAGVALTMTCGQALVDQILTFTDQQWVRVLDECWRQIRYPHIVRRISEGQKLARGDDVTSGSATLIALHRISDLMGAAPDVRELALGLLADCSTRIIYNQADDQVPITRSTLNLTDIEGDLLPRLPQATALWKVAQRSFLVDHTVLRDGYEWDLIQTDSRMGSRKYETVDRPRRRDGRRDPALRRRARQTTAKGRPRHVALVHRRRPPAGRRHRPAAPRSRDCGCRLGTGHRRTVMIMFDRRHAGLSSSGTGR